MGRWVGSRVFKRSIPYSDRPSRPGRSSIFTRPPIASGSNSLGVYGLAPMLEDALLVRAPQGPHWLRLLAFAKVFSLSRCARSVKPTAEATKPENLAVTESLPTHHRCHQSPCATTCRGVWCRLCRINHYCT